MSFYAIQNFKFASSYCRTAYKNGGSALFLKQHLTHKENKTQTYYINMDKTFEHVVTEIKCPNYWLTVVCIYRAPEGCIKTFLQHLEILLDSLKCPDKPLILCGDFNINFFRK